MRYWLEKTLSRGNPLRETYPVGSALVSPTKSEGNVDIYRFMRDVATGDVIVHFVDNRAITGTSRVAEPYKERNALYVVQLTGYKPFVPELSRAFLATEPFRSRLIAIANSGRRHTFFTRLGTLRQGAYLTPLDDDVLAVIRDYASHEDTRWPVAAN